MGTPLQWKTMGLMSTGRVDHTILTTFLLPEVTSPNGDTATVEDHGSDVHWEGGPHYLTTFFSRGGSASWGHYYSGRPWV